MGSISVSTKDFQDIVLVFLLDVMMHGAHADNPLFDEFVKKAKGLGLEGPLLVSVLEMVAQNRVLYSFIKSSLTGPGKSRSMIIVDGSIKSNEPKGSK